MDFVKVASGDGFDVYQQVRRVTGMPKPSGDEVVHIAPDLPERIDEKAIKEALKEFGERVRAISYSLDAGLSVRVEARPVGPCPACGDPVEDSWAFCPGCGASREA
ncbi:MAG: zinc ribbon domain-containing protein [Actinomycetota bacterium]